MMKILPNFLHRLPFTLITLAGLSLVALLTNTTFMSITDHWLNLTGFAPNDLWYGRMERLFVSAWVTSGGFVFWKALFFVTFAVGLAEWLTGWKRAAATFWGVHLLALILLSLIISLGIHRLRDFGLEAAVIARDVGPSAGYFACLGLLSARLKHPWNWVSGVILFALFVIALFTPAAIEKAVQIEFSSDLAHLLAFPLGWFSSLLGQKQARRQETSG